MLLSSLHLRSGAVALWLATFTAQLPAQLNLPPEPPKILPAKILPSAGEDAVKQLVFSEDGGTVVALNAGYDTASVRAWKTDTGELLWEKKTSPQAVVTPDAKRLVEPAKGKLILRELPDGTEVRSWAATGKLLKDQKFTPDGKTLVRRHDGLPDGLSFKGYDVAKGELQFDHKVATEPDLCEFQPLPDNEHLVYYGLRGTLYVVEFKTGAVKKLDDVGDNKLRSPVAISGDGKYLVASVREAEAELFSLATREFVKRLPTEKDFQGNTVRVQPRSSPPTTNLIFDGQAGNWNVWNADTGKMVARVSWHRDEPHYADLQAFTRDGKTMATGAQDGRVFLWDLSSLQKEARVANGPPPAAKRTWTSADGKFKVVATFAKQAGGRVELRREDGKLLTVPLTSLSTADQQYVASLDMAP